MGWRGIMIVIDIDIDIAWSMLKKNIRKSDIIHLPKTNEILMVNKLYHDLTDSECEKLKQKLPMVCW
jgi:hypothetical protein